MEEKLVKVALWCTPRTTSTVLAKCLGAIEGMEVYLELYSYGATFMQRFKKATGKDLPLELDGNEAVYEEANVVWEQVMGDKLIPKRVSFPDIKEELANVTAKYIFTKEMGYAMKGRCQFLAEGFKHTFLIRDPSRVYSSFRKSMISKFEGTEFMPSPDYYDMVQEDFVNLQPMGWFEHLHALWKYVKENIDPNPVIIDAYDLLSRPEATLRAYCESVGFPYSNNLLEWEPSNEMPKNFITAGETLFKHMRQFYDRAFDSTHFVAPRDAGPISRDQLTNDVIRCVEHSTPFYRDMFEHRICV